MHKAEMANANPIRSETRSANQRSPLVRRWRTSFFHTLLSASEGVTVVLLLLETLEGRLLIPSSFLKNV